MHILQFIICTHHHILLGDQIKENEVVGACDPHGIGEKAIQGFSVDARRKESPRKTKA